MSIFTILTYAMLALVVLTGVASIPRSLGSFWDRHGLKRRLLSPQARRVLRDRA
jgi:hypothetical protein